MDQALTELMDKLAPVQAGKERNTGAALKVLDSAKGEIEVSGSGGKAQYVLKPLAELYGEGRGVTAVEPTDNGFMPLFLGIEETIIECYHANPELTDGMVALTLDRLVRNPSAQFQPGELGTRLQARLRLVLSVNNYSRWEVQQAVRKIAKSVARHTAVSGIQGYLDFIDAQFPQVP
jgi:hypothetical protein